MSQRGREKVRREGEGQCACMCLCQDLLPKQRQQSIWQLSLNTFAYPVEQECMVSTAQNRLSNHDNKAVVNQSKTH